MMIDPEGRLIEYTEWWSDYVDDHGKITAIRHENLDELWLYIKNESGRFSLTPYEIEFDKHYLSSCREYTGTIKFLTENDKRYTYKYSDGVVHCEDGPAILYEDEPYFEYFINGVMIDNIPRSLLLNQQQIETYITFG